MFSELANELLNFILTIENTLPTEVTRDQSARDYQLARIEKFVTANEPIHMILPAFPAKSPNPQKTVSQRPDYGEVLALTKLNQLCADIGHFYAPGARITICSDGRVFSDIVQVCDGAVDVYGRDITDILSRHQLNHLHTFTLDDIFSSHNYDKMRTRLILEFAESIDSLRERIQSEPAAKLMFNGIHRFMFEDQLILNPEQSKNQTKERSKSSAYEVIRRSNAWSRLVEQRFPEAIRLSIHPQLPNSKKIGIRLLPSSDLWRTPWHSVTVFNGKDFYLTPRSQIEAAGGILSYAEDKYPYYILNNSTQVAVS